MVLCYQLENVEKHTGVSTVMHRSSSGRRYHVTGMRHSYGCTSHHSLSLEFAGFVGHPSVGVQLALPSCLLKVATQHPGGSSPVSLLRRSSTGVILMLMASLNNSSLVSMSWCDFDMTSAMVVLATNLNNLPLWNILKKLWNYRPRRV